MLEVNWCLLSARKTQDCEIDDELVSPFSQGDGGLGHRLIHFYHLQCLHNRVSV